jgi:hypothetical protein
MKKNLTITGDGPKNRNPIAKALADGQFQQRIVKSRKAYVREKKVTFDE